MTSQVKSYLLLCVVLIASLALLSRATSRSLTSEANDSVNVSQVFDNWVEEYGRTYSSSEEKAKRFAMFKERFEDIEKFNRQGNHTFTLGLDAFSDMTFEEFSTIDIPNPSSISSFRYQDFKLEDLPKSWDWRTEGAVTNVKDQGNCTVQKLIACSKPYGTRGCEGNLPIRGAMASIRGAMTYARDYGLVTEEKLPYMFADDQPCNNDFESLPDMKISGYQVVPEFDEVALAKAVYHQPVVVMHSTSERFNTHRRGIFMDADGECAKGKLSHTSTLVGFGTTPFGQEYWILKNSWGTRWGEHGYMRINRNSKNKRGTCNLATFPVFPTLR
ncbi:PREDICTED: actinidain-like [Fragaria vesca subsp. vesca]